MNWCGQPSEGFKTNQFEKARVSGTRRAVQRNGSRQECSCGRMPRVIDRVCKCGLPVVKRKVR